MSKTKFWVIGLAASAAFFTSLIKYEGYEAKPYLDSAKVATIGIGSTSYENGLCTRQISQNTYPIRVLPS